MGATSWMAHCRWESRLATNRNEARAAVLGCPVHSACVTAELFGSSPRGLASLMDHGRAD